MAPVVCVDGRRSREKRSEGKHKKHKKDKKNRNSEIFLLHLFEETDVRKKGGRVAMRKGV